MIVGVNNYSMYPSLMIETTIHYLLYKLAEVIHHLVEKYLYL